MIYPLLQAFIQMALATQQLLIGPVLGIIEGIAESTASLLKVFAGYYSDYTQKRKQPTIFGYSLSAFSKGLLFLASLGWFFILMSRFLDRVGKGIRSAPRDALISESIPKNMEGKAFGFHRAMDFAGATIGVFLCYMICLPLLDSETKTLRDLNSFYWIFLISIIPAFLGIFFLFLVQEDPIAHVEPKKRPKPNLKIHQYDRNLQLFFLVQFLYTLGNSSNQFLLLQSMTLGYALSSVLLMYLLFNLSSALFSTFFGSLSDRIGKKRILIAGNLLYAIVYLAFGLLTPDSKEWLWLFWILYGVYYAMTEGVEKAFISSLAPKDSKATALGFYYTIVGIGLFPASLIAGVLYAFSTSAPFVFGGAIALLSTGILMCGVHEKKKDLV